MDYTRGRGQKRLLILAFGLAVLITDYTPAKQVASGSLPINPSSTKEAHTSAAPIEIDDTVDGERSDWWASFAAQYDPIQFMRENTSPNLGRRGMNESWYAIEAERVKKIGLQGTRTWFEINWWEPVNDDEDPNSPTADYRGFAAGGPRMKSVYRFLDICQRVDVEVGLNFGWKLRQPTRLWLAIPQARFKGQPHIKDAEEHAESIVTLLKYLRDVKNYTCITHVTFGNEFEYNYPDMYAAALRRMEAEDIRKDYIVCGLEANREVDGMKRNVAYTDILDTLTVHTYSGEFDLTGKLTNYYKLIGNQASRFGNKGRIWFSEFALGGEDSFDRGLDAAMALITSANAGAYAIGGWRLSDQHLPSLTRQKHGSDKFNHGLHLWGTWRWVPWMERPRHVYFAMSLLTRYVPRRSRVHAVKAPPGIRAACFKKKDAMTLVILNTMQKSRNVSFSFNSGKKFVFYRHVYSNMNLPTGNYDTVIPCDRVFTGPKMRDDLPPRSLTVYTTVPDFPQIEVSPYVVQAKPGRKIAFQARVIGKDVEASSVTWSVDGGMANGVIDAHGVYIAPEGLPAIDPVIIRAKLVDPDSSGRATDGLAVVLFSGKPKSKPNRPVLSLNQSEEEKKRGTGPRQFDLGERVSTGVIVRRSFELSNLGDVEAEFTIRCSVPWIDASVLKGRLGPERSRKVKVDLEIRTEGLKPDCWYYEHVFIESPRSLGHDVVDVYFRTAEEGQRQGK